jgi:acyl transferase domain-containing protein/acyl-CoA synthetase (AMP-forming)/AMP-acid ligase II/NADPH:quinone reductase-like Zn-dependent oxidoreductase/acyl carrier protein
VRGRTQDATGPRAPTLVNHFRGVFLDRPQERTYRFLVDGEGDPLTLTNAELDLRARAVAATLRQRFPAGERALIVCPPGLEYVNAFIACLYAGIIAVPVYPPNPALLKRTLPRLLGVIDDARPAVVLAPSGLVALAGEVGAQAPQLQRLAWIGVDDVDAAAADDWRMPVIGGGDTAFLQYTSGSTGQPKGAVVTHANLLDNLAAIHRKFIGADTDTRSVTWLPPYHDMGLIGGLLQPAYGAIQVTFMSPLAFLKKPSRWLRAISEVRATHSGAPNFAYELCVARVTDEECEGLDLNCWKLAFTGAEPVRVDTLDRFTRRFESFGFRRRAFYPCYGLAEATLLVSGGEREAEPSVRLLRADALADNRAEPAEPDQRARAVAGCGKPVGRVVIADPDRLTALPDGQIGEIWVSGPSVAAGYWQRPRETEEVFGFHLADTGEGPFLRTGDLGFLDSGELFVTGRRKDLLIISGRNHYPYDIERSVERCHPSLRHGGVVACALTDGDEEQLLVVAETGGDPAKLDTDAIITAIGSAVADDHELRVDVIALVGRGSVPKTSSGKLQRGACRDAFADGSLQPAVTWTYSPTGRPATPPAAQGATAPTVVTTPATRPATRSTVERWMTELLAARLEVPAETIDPWRPVASYGLRSVDMVGLVGEMERRLGRSLPATLAWEYPTIEALAAHLAETGDQEPPTTPVPAPGVAGTAASEPVAIVGIGCRFPGGADDPDTFWALLLEGRDAVSEVPADRWPVDDYTDEDPSAPGKTNTRWGGFIGGIDQFDPRFFGISPHEAECMDPQQRLLAEVAWEAIENAGVPAEALAATPTGVFIGIATNDHAHLRFRDLDRVDAYSGTGNAASIAANRLSYLFDLRGPSMAIDTACSSSLVAVHQACTSITRGECTMAIAGGVNVILSPALAINFTKAGAMAPDGRCKAFDARADGYVRSEGAGIVVLKPLSQAVADQDTIYAVILGGAVNSDGRTNGLMAPNPHAQQEVLRAAYASAGVQPRDVAYVEAHGTGTLLGDPIEAKALAHVVGDGRDPGLPCLIGSVKSNLGHLEAAAGVAGLVKTALMLHHGAVTPSLHFEQPNPHIPFDDLALRVADRYQPWPSRQRAIAGVSSFGFGGTNAHVVLGEAPRPADAERPARPAPGGAAAQILTLSARGEQALRQLARRYATRLDAVGDGAPFTELCNAAAVRRSHHEHRLACVGMSAAEVRQALRAFSDGEAPAGVSYGQRVIGRRPPVVFVFSGQGPRWWPLAADLAATEPVFRTMIDTCDTALREHVDWSLAEQLALPVEQSRMPDPAAAQPALCAVQIALAQLWRSWGVEPAAVVGHSVGEIAAAHIAGALTLGDALRVAVHRGRVIRSALGQGRMAVAALALDQGRALLAAHGDAAVSIAASNGPTATVFSGETTALEAVAKDLEARGVFCRMLESVDFASHSPVMDGPSDELREALAGLTARATAVPMISTLTGRVADGETFNADYWADNLRQPVLFDPAITELIETGHDTFVEISAHPMLVEPVAERLSEQQARGAVVASLRRESSGRTAMLAELGRLYTAGFAVDWRRVLDVSGPMVALPTYPWQRERCWLDDHRARGRGGDRQGHPVFEQEVRSAVAPHAWHWTGRVDLEGYPYLGDHRVGDVAVLPASLVLEAVLAAGRHALGDPRATIEDLTLSRVTMVDEVADQPTVQLVIQPKTAGRATFTLFSRAGKAPADWAAVAGGQVRASAGAAQPDAPAPTGGPPRVPALTEVQARCQQAGDPAAHYAALHRAGLTYGPAFQGVDALWRGEREALGRLRGALELTGDRDRYQVHPAVLDSALQVLAAALLPEGAAAQTYLPVAVGRFQLTGGPAAVRWASALAGESSADEVRGGRVVLYAEDGSPLGEISGITLRRLDTGPGADPVGRSLLGLEWHEAAVPGQAPIVDPGAWLVLADQAGTCAAVAARLAGRGGRCVTVTTGPGYRRVGLDQYQVDPARRADFTTLLADLAVTGAPRWAGVLHGWALDARVEAPGPPGRGDAGKPRPGLAASLDAASLDAASLDAACLGVVHLVQELLRGASVQAPRVAVLTRGTQAVGTEPVRAAAVVQSAVWGLTRVLAVEHSDLRPVAIDLDHEPVPGEADRVLAELLATGGDGQVALRRGRRFVPRLQAWQSATGTEWARRPYDPRTDTNHRLLAARPGILDSLTPTVWRRVPPGPGQVEIEVAAAGLNFSDVLKALEICPGVPPGVVPLGAECAGRVVGAGEGVTALRIGDRVMAVAPSSLAAYTTTDERLAVPVPQGLTDEQAAAVPIAFLTAVYGLEYLARLRAGESVLIHSAAGGVGLAALQVARRRGARVFATAGSEDKRELLRSMGVEHVMDSRSLAFAEEITEITGGRGVDVVLNSLAGEALLRSLSLLARNGRFVEIGKQDVYANSHLGLEILKHNRSFLAVDLEQMFSERPELIPELFAEVRRGFASGELTPLPVRGFGYREAGAAFSYMAQARHIGKVVLRPDGVDTVAVRPDEAPVRADASYLITGGLGALGLETARYLSGQGARHLVLVGRGGAAPAIEPALAELRDRGIDVHVCRADVARYDDVTAALDELSATMPPLAGVVHAAGVLDDGLLLEMERDRFWTVAAPKVLGAWNLHRATADRPLDFFVMYSSAAALLGSPGQGNYAAANAFLDGLALHRRSHGLSALSIDWGPWAEIGLAAHPERGGALAARGVDSIRPAEGIAALDRLLRAAATQVAVLPLNHDKLREAAASGLLPSLLADLARGGIAPAAAGSRAAGEIRAKLLALEPGRRRRALLEEHCRGAAARVLTIDIGGVDATQPLASMGFDSLMALELRRRLEASLGLDLPPTLAWRFPTIEALVPFLADRMGIALTAGGADAAGGGGGGERAGLEAELERLADDEVEQLLDAKIMQLNEGWR